MSGLVIHKLGVVLGGRRILRDVSLRTEIGEHLVLVGASGAGKTTLLRTIAGLEEATEGSITWGGEDLTRVPPGLRGCGMVFQVDALYPHLTIADNVGLPLKLARVGDDELRRRVHSTLELLGLGESGRLPTHLSGGERQRVALARVLVTQPRLLLLDEPMASLDWPTRVEFRTWLRRIPKEWGCTVVHVTHDPVEALSLGSRFAVIDEGTLRQEGSAREIYDRPDHLSVAGFFGWPPINWIRIGQVDAAHDASERKEHSSEVRRLRLYPDALSGGWAELEALARQEEVWGRDGVGNTNGGVQRLGKREFWVGLRPEDVGLVREGASEERRGLKWALADSLGEVVEHRDAGGECHVAVKLGGGILWVRWAREATLNVGERVKVRAPVDRFHWFDSATGLRVEPDV